MTIEKRNRNILTLPFRNHYQSKIQKRSQSHLKKITNLTDPHHESFQERSTRRMVEMERVQTCEAVAVEFREIHVYTCRPRFVN